MNQKGPEATVLAALHAFKAAKVKLPVNVVLVAEGEEEIGSPNFHQVVQSPKVLAALKKAEGIYIPASWQDSSMPGISVRPSGSAALASARPA